MLKASKATSEWMVVGDFSQQLVEVEDRAEFLRKVRQGFQRAILPVDAPIEPRVVDGHGHARGDQLQQRAILLADRH